MPRDKFLIVDDEDLIRWSLRQKITNWGYQVAEAADGKSRNDSQIPLGANSVAKLERWATGMHQRVNGDDTIAKV